MAWKYAVLASPIVGANFCTSADAS
jgi:hypothetical protein